MPHFKAFFDYFQTYTAIYYCQSELSVKELSKFEFEEKKFSLLLKWGVCGRFWLENAAFSNKLNFFFPRIQSLIFLRGTIQNDHIRLLY